MLRFFTLGAICVALVTPSQAHILNWQTGKLISGTEDVTPGPQTNLSGWNTDVHNLKYASLSSKNLTGSNFSGSWLDHASFTGTNTSYCDFQSATLTGANLTGTTLFGSNLSYANLAGANSTGVFIKETQLYHANLSGWDLIGANLIGAAMEGTQLSQADLRGATLTHATGTAIRHNTIWTGGGIWIDNTTPGIQLTSGEELIIRNYNMAISASGSWTMQQGSTLKMALTSVWQSVINASDAVDLGGELNLSFADGIDPRTLIGTEFKLFNWNGNLTAGDHFDSIATNWWTTWDTSRLYTDGVVTLVAIPEPMTLGLFALGGLVVRRRK